METSLLLAKIVGPVLIVRGISLLIDRDHFLEMVKGLEKQIATISFSMVPVFLMMAGIAIVLTVNDWSTPIGIFLQLMAWGAIVKSTLLILFPRLMVTKAQLLVEAGFLNVVAAMSLGMGAWMCWFGYLS